MGSRMNTTHDNTVADIASSLKTAGALAAKHAARTQLMTITLPRAYAAYGKAVYEDIASHSGVEEFVQSVRALMEQRQQISQAANRQPAATSLAQKAQRAASGAADLAKAKALDSKLFLELERLGRAAYERNTAQPAVARAATPIAKAVEQAAALTKEIDELTVATKHAWLSPQRAILAGVIVFVALASFGLVGRSAWDNSRIRLVKQGKLDACSHATVEKIVNGFMGNPTWESGLAEDRTAFVNVRGDIFVNDRKVRALIQFAVDTKRDTFQFQALEYNGVPQPVLVAAGLFENMCESARAKKGLAARRK